MTIQDELLSEINAFVRKHGLSESGFGKIAMGDFGFVFDLRKGNRSPQIKTVERARDFMRTYSIPLKKRKPSNARPR